MAFCHSSCPYSELLSCLQEHSAGWHRENTGSFVHFPKKFVIRCVPASVFFLFLLVFKTISLLLVALRGFLPDPGFVVAIVFLGDKLLLSLACLVGGDAGDRLSGASRFWLPSFCGD